MNLRVIVLRRLILCLLIATCNLYSQDVVIKEGTRQIHLDFHTSEKIKDIGSLFTKEQFKSALQKGRVNSINIFAKGHHGWSYYPTKVGSQHPYLNFDLMGEQIAACKELDIRVQAYFTVGWSAKDAEDHPEWVIKNKEGNSINNYSKTLDELRLEGKPMPDTFWEYLAPTKTYKEFMLNQVKEICENYELDGFWFDILLAYPNYGQENRELMKEAGVDISDEQAVQDFSMEVIRDFAEEAKQLILSYNPDATIFFNGLTNTRRSNNYIYHLYEVNTKQDLEDLPTTWDGYDKFPYRAKYFASTGKEIVAMSGKFHSAWGEFGGFKDKDAIKYEAASMIAFGANANFGDQLHPSGEMNISTYENIGYAFDYVSKIEEYGINGKHVAKLGLWIPIELDIESTEGAAKLLMENQVDFVVINKLKNWSDLELVVIPSASKFTAEEIKKINQFVIEGGKLIVMGNAVLGNKNELLFDIGAEYVGKPKYDKDYTVVGQDINNDIVSSPFLNYIPATRFKPKIHTKVLARIKEPYFSRTPDHYTSHRNTPYRLEFADHPSIIRNGNIIYIAHPLDKIYYQWGSRLHRDIFYNTLMLLHEKPMIIVNLPSAGRINLLHQPNQNRYVAHLLYANPHQRGFAQVIEDFLPLHNIDVTVDLPIQVKRAYTIPDNKSLDLHILDDKTKITIPEFSMHTGVVFEY